MTEIEEKQIKNLINEVIIELKNRKMLKEYVRTPYQKVEVLLFSYPTYKQNIAEKEEMIQEVSQCGVRKKSPSLVGAPQGNLNIQTESDKATDKIAELESSIRITKSCIAQIDRALNKLKDDHYYQILPMFYFEKRSRDEIASYFDVEASTITRNKSRLVNELKVILFSDDCILELMT